MVDFIFILSGFTILDKQVSLSYLSPDTLPNVEEIDNGDEAVHINSTGGRSDVL